MKKKTVKKQINSSILYELEGSVDEAIAYLQKLKDTNSGNLELEVDRDRDGSYLTLWSCRKETDEEYQMRLRREKKDKELEEFEAKRQYERLKKRFEK